jgi:hypothetical protein
MLIITNVMTTLVQTRPNPQSTYRSLGTDPRRFHKVGDLAVMVEIVSRLDLELTNNF